MDTAYRFIIIDADESNSFISCKAIMLASRETVIQTFADTNGTFNYLVERRDHQANNRTILFLSENFPDNKAQIFLEQFATMDNAKKRKLEIYLLKSKENSDVAYKGDILKGEIELPLTAHKVAECIINFS